MRTKQTPMMSAIYKPFIAVSILSLLALVSAAQVKSVYEAMSLDEILNVDVAVTASKQPEDLFETPLSVTIIKKEDIYRSGATSIMEALRLSQGLIVREVTPGNFDVQIRGFDDMTKNNYITLPYNTTTLVMIDNRIVYSYFSGGTFWESLPIDIHDIERIEVVRGPASALYGPNAATGVINIITSHAEEPGLSAFASAATGSGRSKLLNTNIGYNWKNKTSLTLTMNFTERSRFDTMYYNWYTSEFTSMDNLMVMMDIEKNKETHEVWNYRDFSDSLHTRYDQTTSLRKLGANIFFDHEFNAHSNFSITLGAQKSQCQKPGFLNFATPLSQNNTSSYYLDSKIKFNNLYGQFNASTGQDLNSHPGNSFKFFNSDANVDYLLQFTNFSIRPGISLKSCSYNSPITYREPFDFIRLNYQFKDEPRIMNSIAGSVLSEWNPISSLRIIGGARVDKFNTNKNYFLNYELGATFRIDKKNLIRAVYSHANRSPFILDTYLNATMNFYYAFKAETNVNPVYLPSTQNLLAKRDQKYPTNNSFEICWRNKFSQKVSFDAEFFSQKINNLLVSNAYREVHTKVQLTADNQMDSLISAYGTSNMYFENFDVGARQFGLSFMLQLIPHPKYDLKFYATAQKTILNGISDVRYNTTDTKIALDEANKILSTVSQSNTNMTLWSEKLTPALYGGFIVNYMPGKCWNMNLNGYMYSKQVFAGIPFYNIISDYTGIFWNNYMTIKPYAILNARVIYKIQDKTKVFVSIKNMLGKHREFGFSDTIGTTFLVGFQWSY